MLISQAWAQASGGGGTAGLEQFLPFVLIFVVFYFLLLRPQQTKAKKHREMVNNLRRGDRIASQGGIIGTVIKVVSDSEVQVEIAEGVRIRLLRNAVTDVMAKTEPVAGAAGAKDKPANDASGAEAAANDADPPPPPPPPPPSGLGGLLSRLLGGK